MATDPILRVEAVSKSFGGVRAINNLSFDVPGGCIKAVIGPNGAGKSTLFNLISGLDSPTSGQILFEGRTLNGLKPSRRAALGLGRTFQTPQIFANMTVLENVLIGRHLHGKAGLFAALFYTGRSRAEDRRLRTRCLELLDRFGLADQADEPAADLAFGQLKLLEMARALALDPKLLLLDEFAAGLTRKETDHMGGIVRAIREEGITVLLVEHDMPLVMNLSDEIVVLDFGAKIGEGVPDTVQQDAKVIEIYLGSEALTC